MSCIVLCAGMYVMSIALILSLMQAIFHLCSLCNFVLKASLLLRGLVLACILCIFCIDVFSKGCVAVAGTVLPCLF